MTIAVGWGSRMYGTSTIATTTQEMLDMATIYVVANDAPTAEKAKATAGYLCDGTADDVQLNAAVTQLKSDGGGRALMSMGNFNLAAPVDLYGVDDVDSERMLMLAGLGQANTWLNPTSGIAAGIRVSKSAQVQLDSFSISVHGTTHGISAINSGVAGSDYRSLSNSDVRNIQVVGPWDGSHTGWALHLDNPFRSRFTNIEMGGVLNGIRCFSSNNAFNPGDCTFDRCFADLSGNSGFAYKVESTVTTGTINQMTFNLCEGIASGTGCTGYYMGGTGPVTHCKWRAGNLEQFDTLVNFNNGYGNTVDLNYCELRNTAGLTAFVFGSGSSGNEIERVGFLYCPVNVSLFAKAGGSATYPNIARNINFYGDGGTVSLGFTGPANTPGTDTLLRKMIANTGVTAAGSNVTYAPGAVNF